MPDIGTAVT